MAEREITLDGKTIGDDTDCYVIAEIGANHMGKVEVCKEIMQMAKICGADAIKLQKRDNRSLYTRAMFDSPYDNRNSFGATYGEHREFLEFGQNEYRELKAYAEELGITFCATAFDLPSADFLEELDPPFYKIASGDLTNIPLLKHVAGFGKPLIFSTGGGAMEDVRRAFDAVAALNGQVAIMQCTSGYPAEFDQLNLRVIETYREAFPKNVIGYSGHDNGIAMALVAYMLGARIVEKHFTINRAWKGTDQAFSLEPGGLRRLVRDLHRARIALGSPEKAPLPIEEQPMYKMKKHLVAARDLPAGHVLRIEDIAIRCPGKGLAPYEIDAVTGRTLARPLAEDEAIGFEHLEAAS